MARAAAVLPAAPAAPAPARQQAAGRWPALQRQARLLLGCECRCPLLRRRFRLPQPLQPRRCLAQGSGCRQLGCRWCCRQRPDWSSRLPQLPPPQRRPPPHSAAGPSAAAAPAQWRQPLLRRAPQHGRRSCRPVLRPAGAWLRCSWWVSRRRCGCISHDGELGRSRWLIKALAGI